MNSKTLAVSRATAPGVVLASTLVLGGCGMLQSVLPSGEPDYKSQSAKTAPLDVPPDLTQLARDGRFRPQGGTVSASGSGNTGAAAAAAAGPAAQPGLVAPSAIGKMRVERDGAQRWLVVPMAPEQLWPVLQTFWQERGFKLETDNPQVGVMETAWTENRAKIPQDMIRGLIGKVFDGLYSSAERERFRVRVERTGEGSEVYISQRSLEETASSALGDSRTVWRARPADPQREAEFLTRLMVRLSGQEDASRTAVAQAAETPAKARPVPAAAGATAAAAASTATSVEVDEGFDRAWRRIGLALDRSGFTVEDRDRAAGVYFVRYVDPNAVPKEDQNIFERLFGSADKAQPVRYRVVVKAQGTAKSVATVQNAKGEPETGEAARRIVAMLLAQLR